MDEFAPRVRARSDDAPPGFVSLVGAGPGDPGLLTLKGSERLRNADVVYYDALICAETLAHCRKGARLVPVGKRRGLVTLSQTAIERALVRDARRGLAVVRLKGGDPFVFGRGAEEALALLEARVPFEIVPGVSSGTAVPAAAGIPVTHRGSSRSVAFLTAHDLGSDEDGGEVSEKLAHLARGADTLVLFMAGAELDRLGSRLLEAGLPPETPAAVIESGTLPRQTVRRGTLAGLPVLGAEGRGGPVLVVVGRTVAFADVIRAARPDERQRTKRSVG